MDELLLEEEAVLHRALIKCLRESSSPEERQSFLLLIESTIGHRSGLPFFPSLFYSQMSVDLEAVMSRLRNEVSQVKMEDQVSSLLLDSSPPDNPLDENYLNLQTLNLSDSDDFGDSSADLVDLSQLIVMDSQADTITIEPAMYNLDSVDAVFPLENPIPFNGPTTGNFEPVECEHVQIVDNGFDHSQSSTRAPGSATRAPASLIPPPTQTTAPATSSPGFTSSPGTFSVLRPKGHLPPSSPLRQPSSPFMGPPQVFTEQAPNPPPDYQTTHIVRQASSNGPSRQTSSDRETLSRHNSTDSRRQDSTDSTPRTKSSSGEEDWSATGKPDLQRGITVYRSKRISHAQLQAFLEDGQLKTKLRQLGSVYLISPSDDPNFYNISLSGNKGATTAALEALTAGLPKDSTTYTATQLTIPSHKYLGPTGYVFALLKQVFSRLEITCIAQSNTLEYKLCGQSEMVAQAGTLIRFMASLPDKEYGMLFKLHPRLTSSEELVSRLVNTAQQITKTEVHCLDSSKTEACKFLFVPGLCGQPHHFRIQKHLNVLVERLEDVEETLEPEVEQEEQEEEDEKGEVTRRYTIEEMMEIRKCCVEPLPELTKQSTLPILCLNHGVFVGF